jgi:ankyrin repeat protein
MEKLKNMGNDILKLTNEIVIEIDGIEGSIIDVMIARFPHVVTDIFKELDDKTLTTCRNVSRLCCDYIDSEKFLWVRIIQSYRKNIGISYPCWNKVLKNTPIELVKEFSVSTQQFFKEETSRNDFHWCPMQMFAEQGNLELCKHILEKVKKLKPRIIKTHNLPTYYDHPILIAAKKGHEEICKLLIDNTEEKNPSDTLEKTALHFAAENGLTDVCKLIIENIDDKNPAALNGCTPLHLAAKEGHLEIIRLFVETGVE